MGPFFRRIYRAVKGWSTSVHSGGIISAAMAYFAWTPVMLSILWFGLVAGLTSTLQQVTDFGINPTNVGMFVYVPTNITATPAVVVAIHDCNGTAQTYLTSTPYAQFADTYGFIVVYPNSTNAGSCWDVRSNATLTHNGGGDSQGIASMVGYAISTYSADPTRVFVTGTASGGTMTNILCAVYPDLWRAASAYSGAAAGCFVNTSSDAGAFCTPDDIIMDGSYWVPLVRAMNPGYTGAYPPISVWYGETNFFNAYLTSYGLQSLEEWAGIFEYDTNEYQALGFNGYQKQIYGPNLQTNFDYDEVDPLPVHGDEDMAWFGIDPSLAPPVLPPPPPPPPVQHFG
ncbi:Carbohydrate esterase family 1 and carbohydrate-binding module family 1 protein [Mycena venus]|uniref:Carboxylic ester hydrolase n=1 Tax=Mycena venus TaxID=2733690 RepID=A0A8H6XAK0_9AGAR|nr:Carbohydrate esterase family 1 and carbohydrate-binding module family 1 protein [Mycena venus]